MKDKAEQEITYSPHIWKQVLDDHWEQQLADDETDFDIGFLAAYAEGRLSAEEELTAQAVLARSPSALQCFLAMRDQVEEALISTSHAPSVSTSNGAIPNRQRSGKALGWFVSAFGRFAVAASLMIATVATGWAVFERNGQNTLRSQLAALRASAAEDSRIAQLEVEIADLRQKMADATSIDNLLRQKEQGVILASQRTPQFLAGRISPSLLSTVLLDFPRARGLEPLTPAEQELRNAVSVRWTSAAETMALTTSGQKSGNIELAFEKLVLKGLDEARSLLGELKEQFAEDPQVQNLEAVILLREASLTPSADGATRLETSARDLLEAITQNHPDLSEPWLNLAMLVERKDGRPAALPYWKRYLEVEGNPEIVAVVRSVIE